MPAPPSKASRVRGGEDPHPANSIATTAIAVTDGHPIRSR
jgi:hypothetical protein